MAAAPVSRVAMLHDYVQGQRFVTCPNQDVVYGLGYYDLDTEPAVIQVSDNFYRSRGQALKGMASPLMSKG